MMMKRKSWLRVNAAGLLAVALLLMFASITTGYTQGASPAPAKAGNPVNNVPAESDNLAQNITNPNPPPEIIEDRYERTYPELMFTLMVVVLAVAALSMQFFLLKRNAAIQAEDSLRSFGVTLIIIGTLFFVTAGFDSTQIAPALGLFGTIAGYLLGKTRHAVPAMNQTKKGNR